MTAGSPAKVGKPVTKVDAKLVEVADPAAPAAPRGGGEAGGGELERWLKKPPQGASLEALAGVIAMVLGEQGIATPLQVRARRPPPAAARPTPIAAAEKADASLFESLAWSKHG